MDRKTLRDDQWERVQQLLSGKKGDPGCTAKDNRCFVEAVLWIMRTGAHGVIYPSSLAGGTGRLFASRAGARKELGSE